jgi:hypothetical protein
MKARRIIFLSLLIIVTMVLSLYRFGIPHNFPDALKYARYVELFLGLDPEPIPAPFIFRPLVPLLSTPLAIFTGPIVSLSITSMVSMAAWVVILYHICLELVDRDLIAFIVSGAALTTPITWNYGGAPLVDVTAMCFVGAIVLLTLRQGHDSTILSLLFFGVFAKELVFFAGLFYLLHTRTLSAIWAILAPLPAYLLFRYAMTGGISQPLAIHEIQPWAIAHTLYALSILIIMSVPYMLVRGKRELELCIIGLLAFVPYMLLGMFNAYYGPRFAWPVQLALIPLACAGLNYMLSWKER